MTLEQFCKKYQYTQKTVLHAFPKVQKSIMKKYGIKITKVGRGLQSGYIEEGRSEEAQMMELRLFLEANPLLKEYFEGLEY